MCRIVFLLSILLIFISKHFSECYVTMKPSLFGQLSANATLHDSAKDERTCVAACIAKSDCISVQFKFSDKNWLCFLQHNFQAFKPENLMYHPNVTEYVITKRCHEKNACSRGQNFRLYSVYAMLLTFYLKFLGTSFGL